MTGSRPGFLDMPATANVLRNSAGTERTGRIRRDYEGICKLFIEYVQAAVTAAAD